MERNIHIVDIFTAGLTTTVSVCRNRGYRYVPNGEGAGVIYSKGASGSACRDSEGDEGRYLHSGCVICFASCRIATTPCEYLYATPGRFVPDVLVSVAESASEDERYTHDEFQVIPRLCSGEVVSIPSGVALRGKRTNLSNHDARTRKVIGQSILHHSQGTFSLAIRPLTKRLKGIFQLTWLAK